MGRVVAQRPGGEGQAMPGVTLDQPKRPHPTSPFGSVTLPKTGREKSHAYFLRNCSAVHASWWIVCSTTKPNGR